MTTSQPDPQSLDDFKLWQQGHKLLMPIFERARAIVARVAQRNPQLVFPWQSLQEDLELQSVTYFELLSQLAGEFNITILPADLFPQDIFWQADYLENGTMNAIGIAALQARLPWFSTREWEMEPTVQNFSQFFTVQDLVCYIACQLRVLEQ